MKKFSFRFQTVLDLRERELEKAELKVAEAQKDVYDANQKLIELKETLKKTRSNLGKALEAGSLIEITQINGYQNYIAFLERKIVMQHKTIKELQVILEKKRQEMLIIRQKKMMLEKLKEKELKNYLKEYELNDLKMIDEISTNRHKRNPGV